MALLPKVKLKSVVSFPTNVIGGTGINVSKANGSYTFDLNHSELAPVVTVALSDTANTWLVLWNSTQNSYSRISLTAFKALLAAMP